MVQQLQVAGYVPKIYLPVNLFNIHVRLQMCVPKKYLPINLFNIYVRLQMCKKFEWWKFGEFLISRQFRQILAVPKFPSIRYTYNQTINYQQKEQSPNPTSRVVIKTYFLHKHYRQYYIIVMGDTSTKISISILHVLDTQALSTFS